jgi:hypothetical protein
LAQHHRLRIDETESVDDNLSFHRLYRIDDDGDGARSQLFEALLSVYIDRGEPAAEARMRMVPANNGFGPGQKNWLV